MMMMMMMMMRDIKGGKLRNKELILAGCKKRRLSLNSSAVREVSGEKGEENNPNKEEDL